jgi:hypothetical protein
MNWKEFGKRYHAGISLKGLRKTKKKLQRRSYPGWNSNIVPAEYESGTLP